MEPTELLSSVRIVPQDSFLIREATPADLPVIVAQRRRMYSDMGYSDRERLEAMTEVFAKWLRERLEDGRYHNWLVEDSTGRLAAGAGLWLVEWPPQMMDFSPLRGYIMNVYTEPGFRCRGLARALVQTILGWCAAHDIHTVSLHASADGRPVYESLGFAPTNELRLHI